MILVIGYGNPGRGDDGLGPAFAERIEQVGLPGIEVSVDYQLTVEHALELARVPCVVFADAAIDMDAPFAFRAVRPDRSSSIDSHALAPEALLALTETLYGAQPEAHVMAISGVRFGTVEEGLSEVASSNLDAAFARFRGWASLRAQAATG